MKRKPRLFFDVTFTKTQDINVGITRTVKRLLTEMETLAPAHGMVCVPVVFSTKGFRVFGGAQPNASGDVSAADAPWREKLRLWITKGPLRRIVSARFPLPLRWLAWSVFSWWEFNRLSRGLPRIDVQPGDVVFLCDASWSYRVWLAAKLARKQGARVVTVVYDLIPLRQPEYCTPLTTIALRRWLHKQLPCSDAVLCISRAVEQDVRRYAAEAQLNIPATAHFRLGCDPVSASAGEGEVRQALLDFVGGAPCFTAVGSIEPRKNYAFLVDAFERLWAGGVNARLLIIGRRDSQCADVLDRIQHHAELGKRLLAVFDGTDAELTFAYRNSRALLFPSLAEGFGLPLVEARAHGCRVIASDLPAFAELADEGVSTFRLECPRTFDGLVMLHLGNTERAAAMRPFTWHDSARTCMEVVLRFAPLQA